MDMDRFFNDQNLERLRSLASIATTEAERKILLGLRERCERLPAVDYADRQTVGIGLRRGREGKRQERVLVVLFKNDDGAGEFAAPLSAA